MKEFNLKKSSIIVIDLIILDILRVYLIRLQFKIAEL